MVRGIGNARQAKKGKKASPRGLVKDLLLLFILYASTCWWLPWLDRCLDGLPSLHAFNALS